MKKVVIILILLLTIFTAATAQPAPDTVVAVAYPDTLLQSDLREWDFSALPATGATPIVSTLEYEAERMTVREVESRFHFELRPEGHYFSGWEDPEKIVTLQQGYNQHPSLLRAGSSYTTPYTASGEYLSSGVTTSITGAYSLEVMGAGALLLPDGRRFCAATLVKTNDRYHETSCNTTEVHTEKYLWYVPYYPLPVFAAITTAYSYTGGGSDTLRSAYYTTNAMPAPEIRSNNNDTLICIGSEVKIHASGYGLFSLRDNTLDMPFEAFVDTVVVQPQQTTTYILRAADEQCNWPSVYDTVTVTVETPPVLQMLNGDTTVCETTTVALHATSDYQLQWYVLEEENAVEMMNTQVTPLVTTRYIAKAYNTVCTPALDTITVTVETPLRLFIHDTVICQSAPVALHRFSNQDVQWYALNDEGDTVELTATVVRPSVTTRYMAATRNATCTPATDSIIIRVETPPVLQMFSRDTTICESVTVELHATSDQGLLWYAVDDDGYAMELTDSTVLPVTPAVTTRYVAKAYNTACAPVLDTVKVTVNPVPDPAFITVQSGNDVIFHITAPLVRGYNYSFDFGDLYRAYNLQMYLHTYRKAGSYTATLTVANPHSRCERMFSQEIVTAEEVETKFLFYPNPVEHIANVITPATITYYRVVEVATGRVLMEQTLPGTETAIQIDMQGLHTGAYVIQLISGGQWFTNVFIKTK